MPNTPEKSSRSAIDTKELKKHITSECKKTEQKILEKIPGMEDTLKKLMERNMKLEKDLGQFLNLRLDQILDLVECCLKIVILSV